MATGRLLHQYRPEWRVQTGCRWHPDRGGRRRDAVKLGSEPGDRCLHRDSPGPRGGHRRQPLLRDTDTNSVRKIDTNGILTTVAGGGNLKPGDGQQATLAELVSPEDVALDGAGNLYIADTFNHGRVRKVDTHGIITTVAGTGSLMGSAVNGQPAAQAYFSRPTGLAVDGAGNLYIADAGLYYVTGSIPKASSPFGRVTAPDLHRRRGTGHQCRDLRSGQSGGRCGWEPLYPGHAHQQHSQSGSAGHSHYRCRQPWFFGFRGRRRTGHERHIVLARGRSAGHRRRALDRGLFQLPVRKVDAAGVIATVAGLSGWSYAGDGGQATSAQLSAISGVALDAAGNLFIADTNNVRIREVSKAGIITTVAGSGIMGSSGDGGPATSASSLRRRV